MQLLVAGLLPACQLVAPAFCRVVDRKEKSSTAINTKRITFCTVQLASCGHHRFQMNDFNPGSEQVSKSSSAVAKSREVTDTTILHEGHK